MVTVHVKRLLSFRRNCNFRADLDPYLWTHRENIFVSLTFLWSFKVSCRCVYCEKGGWNSNQKLLKWHSDIFIRSKYVYFSWQLVHCIWYHIIHSSLLFCFLMSSNKENQLLSTRQPWTWGIYEENQQLPAGCSCKRAAFTFLIVLCFS